MFWSDTFYRSNILEDGCLRDFNSSWLTLLNGSRYFI